MTRKLSILAAVVTLMALTAVAAMAAKPGAGSPHLVGDYSVSGEGTNSITITGKVAGLGSGWNGATAAATATGLVDVTCTSPGGNVAPGQQDAPATLSLTGTVGGPEQNGNYSFTVTGGVDTTSAKRLGCPNNNWTASATITGVVLTSLSFSQPGLGTVDVRL